MWRGLIDAYRDRLPVTDATPVITLHEGNTPLVPAPVLSQRTGADVHSMAVKAKLIMGGFFVGNKLAPEAELVRKNLADVDSGEIERA